MYSSYVVTKSAKELREVLSTVIEDASNDLAGLARMVIERAQSQWAELNAHLEWCDARIGGKNNLGSITKRGDKYVRMLLIQGAKSAVMTAHKRDEPCLQVGAPVA